MQTASAAASCCAVAYALVKKNLKETPDLDCRRRKAVSLKIIAAFGPEMQCDADIISVAADLHISALSLHICQRSTTAES